MDRTALEQRWLTLTREIMPGFAHERGWPVRADHCFQRILLDHAVGGCWYDHVAGRPAYRHIAADALARAVEMGEAVVAGTVDLHRLNRQSLTWRGTGRGTGRGKSGEDAGQRGLRRGEQRDRGGGERQDDGGGMRSDTGHGEIL
jgi:hypothetical protein